MNTKHAYIALTALAVSVSGCASTTAVFNPIEARTTQSIIKLKMHTSLVETGAEASRSFGINLDTFRAKVMNTTSIRFVEANEDATLEISFIPARTEGLLFKDVVQDYTIRIKENTGKVIFIIVGQLVAPFGQPAGFASELNRVFLERVVPVLEGKSDGREPT